MNVWGISDLHLSFAAPDRRERFAARWRDHAAKIEENWRAVVRPDDLVLLPGDFSMARNHREVQPDLEWLGRLPGRKVLGPGNHDRWWNNVTAVRRLLRRSMVAVGGDAASVDGVLVCGTRGVPAMSRRLGDRRTSSRSIVRWTRWSEPSTTRFECGTIPRLHSTFSGIFRRSTPTVNRVRGSSVSSKPGSRPVFTDISTSRASGRRPSRAWSEESAITASPPMRSASDRCGSMGPRA